LKWAIGSLYRAAGVSPGTRRSSGKKKKKTAAEAGAAAALAAKPTQTGKPASA